MHHHRDNTSISFTVHNNLNTLGSVYFPNCLLVQSCQPDQFTVMERIVSCLLPLIPERSKYMCWCAQQELIKIGHHNSHFEAAENNLSSNPSLVKCKWKNKTPQTCIFAYIHKENLRLSSFTKKTVVLSKNLRLIGSTLSMMFTRQIWITSDENISQTNNNQRQIQVLLANELIVFYLLFVAIFVDFNS